MLNTGIFTEKLNTAHIKTVFKKSDMGEIGNYIPVALFLNISKIFQRIINNRLILYLEIFDMLSSNHFECHLNIQNDWQGK